MYLFSILYPYDRYIHDHVCTGDIKDIICSKTQIIFQIYDSLRAGKVFDRAFNGK